MRIKNKKKSKKTKNSEENKKKVRRTKKNRLINLKKTNKKIEKINKISDSASSKTEIKKNREDKILLESHKNTEKKLKLTKKEEKELKLNESKIKKLLEIKHLEELFFVISLLNSKQVALFIEHYKNSRIEKSPDSRVDSIIKNSSDHNSLIESIKKELASELYDELEKIKENISKLNKRGYDTFIESVRVISIPLKINLFLATGKKEDLYKVKKIINSVNLSLKEKMEELENKQSTSSK
ncbi:MAG: hypothetical protein QXJ28_01565 [Candidatus Pacearchaeota archaeon]